MRSRFALAAALLLVSLGAVPAPAFDRYTVQSGDTVTGEILVPFTFDELALDTALGSFVTVSISSASGASFRPGMGLYDGDYAPTTAIALGPATLRNASPLASGTYRVVVGGQGPSIGSYRVKVAVKPALSFGLVGSAAAATKSLTFGAYPGFDVTVATKWKGPAPVTVASITGPDGTALTGETPVISTRTAVQSGFHTTRIGDHTLVLDVPDGTVSWAASVRLSGHLPRGTARDFRGSTPVEQTVRFPSFGIFPVATVAGEVGGPNDGVLSVRGNAPDALFLNRASGTSGCGIVGRSGEVPATKYFLYCSDGYFIDADSVERDTDGRVTRFEAPSIRTPAGSGSASLSGFTYDAQGRPTGWTEVRRFDASGREHELVFSNAIYFAGNGYCKGFRVTHRLLPDGPARSYDYAPLR